LRSSALRTTFLTIGDSSGGSGGGVDIPSPSQGSSDSSSVGVIAEGYLQRDTPPGKYAAFIRRENQKDVEAVVFTYEKIQIITVSSVADIPSDDLFARTAENTDFDFSSSASGLEKSVDKVRQQKPPPYVIHGNVVVEIGPMINRDQLAAQLITQHGDLKYASIKLIDGPPRGPPDSEVSDESVRTIYVVGQVLKFTGPPQMDSSALRASIIDLGPTQKDWEQYVANSKESEFQREIKRPDPLAFPETPGLHRPDRWGYNPHEPRPHEPHPYEPHPYEPHPYEPHPYRPPAEHPFHPI